MITEIPCIFASFTDKQSLAGRRGIYTDRETETEKLRNRGFGVISSSSSFLLFLGVVPASFHPQTCGILFHTKVQQICIIPASCSHVRCVARETSDGGRFIIIIYQSVIYYRQASAPRADPGHSAHAITYPRYVKGFSRSLFLPTRRRQQWEL